MPNFILIHKLIEGELREENAILLSGQDSIATHQLDYSKKLSNWSFEKAANAWKSKRNSKLEIARVIRVVGVKMLTTRPGAAC